MAKRDPVQFTTPVGRFVGGDVHKAKPVIDDKTKQQKLIGSGANKGEPLSMFNIAIAVPKTQADWKLEPGWGQTIAAEGLASWPGGQTQRPDFAWKIIDGDSQIPNKNMKRPCDRDGYPGHWVLWFSGIGAPVILTTIGTPGGAPQQSTVDNLINLGDYIQIGGSVSGNESAQTAGVYLNHTAVCLRGYGPRIAKAVDVESFGFGAAALPASASMTPIGGDLPQTVAPPLPAAPPMAAQPPAAPPQVPVTPLPPTLPPTPPAGPRMVTGPDGQRHDYAGMISAGWSDALLQANGYTL